MSTDSDCMQNQQDLAFKQVLERVKAEFLEMPGLSLTLPQAARLWSLDPAICQSILATLEDSRFLIRTRHSTFARAE